MQRVKGHTPVQLDDQFAVEDKSLERDVQQRRHNFGEETAQRRSGFPLQLDRAALPERQTTKAVPFGLELPFGPVHSEAFPRISPPSAQRFSGKEDKLGNSTPVHRALIREPPLSARSACRSTSADNVWFQSGPLATYQRLSRGPGNRFVRSKFTGRDMSNGDDQ